MPKITLNPFSPSSIAKAAELVKEYADDLPKKVKLLRERVAEEMAKLAQEGFNGADDEDIIYGDVTVEKVDVYVKTDGEVAFVVADGKSAIWQEFGAGVYHNPGGVGSSPNPLGPQNAYYIGTYGKGHGAQQVWGFYDPPDSKNLVLTRGTPASMPMYKAEKAVIEKIVQIAREVFSEGGC